MQTVIIVGGVSGCGKSTLSLNICKAINGVGLGGAASLDADDFHSQANREKMSRGIGLDDDDRLPWLNAVCEHVGRLEASPVVVACSALKKFYRDIFRERLKCKLVFIILNPSRKELERRLANRQGHFATATLLDSQFATLELPNLNEEPDCLIKNEFGDGNIADLISSMSLSFKPKTLFDLPQELLEQICLYLNGFQLISLSRVSSRFKVLIHTSKGIWKRKLFDINEEEEMEERDRDFPNEYSSALSLFFQTTQGEVAGSHQPSNTMGLGSSMHFPLLDMMRLHPSFSLQIWFSPLKVSNVIGGGILLGSNSCQPSTMQWPHYHQQPIILDAHLNMYCSFLESEKPVLTRLNYGKWYHLVVTHEVVESSPTLRKENVYLDGKLVASLQGQVHHELEYGRASQSQIGTGCISAGSVGKPSQDHCGWYSFNGFLDRLESWPKALISTEVAKLHQGRIVQGSTRYRGPYHLVQHVSTTRPLEGFCERFHQKEKAFDTEDAPALDT